jgi:hypothetical protein
MGSMEFASWMHYLEQEINDFHREDYYLAQIAAEVRRAFSKDPKSVKLKDLLLEFHPEEKKTKPMSKKTRIQQSKNFWLALAGVQEK